MKKKLWEKVNYAVSVYNSKRCTPVEQMSYSYMEKIENYSRSDVILLAPKIFLIINRCLYSEKEYVSDSVQECND